MASVAASAVNVKRPLLVEAAQHAAPWPFTSDAVSGANGVSW